MAGINPAMTENRKRAYMSNLRTLLVALATMLASVSFANADSGFLRISFLKAGWVIGGNVGSGTLTFRGRTYPLTVGGMSYGFTFGGSQTTLRGTVHNINHPSDIEGVYGAAGAGATIIRGPQAIVLTNQKGAMLQLSGNQTGLMVNLDVSGMALSLR
jgi:lipid-binding SYLF domain-containing protein